MDMTLRPRRTIIPFKPALRQHSIQMHTCNVSKKDPERFLPLKTGVKKCNEHVAKIKHIDS